jgi:hypothetical protein
MVNPTLNARRPLMREHIREGPMIRCVLWVLLAFGLSLRCAVAADYDLPASAVLRPSLDGDGDVVALDEVVWTVEGRYWHSNGETSYSIDSSQINPAFGNPTSRLRYQELEGRSGEIEVRGDEVGTGLFGKAMLGLGRISSGTMNDQDWLTGQVLFSDTTSQVRNGTLAYVVIDGGSRLAALSAGPISTGIFAGYGFWRENAPAYGARCNPDDMGNVFCPLDVDLISPATTGVTNQVNWHMLRLGAETNLKIGSILTLSGEVAVIPIAFLANDDFHHYRSDLGPVPNVFHQAPAFGIQAQAVANIHLTPNWSVGAGARYWQIETYERVGSTKFGHVASWPHAGLNRMDSSRYGILATSALRF